MGGLLYREDMDEVRERLTIWRIENLKALKREFGEKLKAFMINMRAESPAQAEEILKIATI